MAGSNRRLERTISREAAVEDEDCSRTWEYLDTDLMESMDSVKYYASVWFCYVVQTGEVIVAC